MTDKYSLLVFDWDGTLMDSEAKIVTAMQSAISDVKLPQRSRDQVKNIIGLGLTEALMALFPDATEEQYQALVEQYRHHFLFANDMPMPLFDGVCELLETLNEQGYWLAVATGKSRRGLNRVFDEHDLHKYFHATRCADESHSKPHPHMLDEIMDELGVMKSDTLMIGDTEYDMLMAKNAGTHALGVSYGVHEKSRLFECGAIGCLDDIRELMPWLDSTTK